MWYRRDFDVEWLHMVATCLRRRMVAHVVAVILTFSGCMWYRCDFVTLTVNRLCGPSRESWGVGWPAALAFSSHLCLLTSSCATTDPREYAVWRRIELCRRTCLCTLFCLVIFNKVQCSDMSSTQYNRTISIVPCH